MILAKRPRKVCFITEPCALFYSSFDWLIRLQLARWYYLRGTGREAERSAAQRCCSAVRSCIRIFLRPITKLAAHAARTAQKVAFWTKPVHPLPLVLKKQSQSPLPHPRSLTLSRGLVASSCRRRPPRRALPRRRASTWYALLLPFRCVKPSITNPNVSYLYPDLM